MAEWLMSVVGIVAAGVLLEIILPPGDTAKYAKGAYALIVVRNSSRSKGTRRRQWTGLF